MPQHSDWGWHLSEIERYWKKSQTPTLRCAWLEMLEMSIIQRFQSIELLKVPPDSNSGQSLRMQERAGALFDAADLDKNGFVDFEEKNLL